MKRIDTYKCCILKKKESNLPYDLALVTQIKNRKPFLYICFNDEYITLTINKKPIIYTKLKLSETEIEEIRKVKKFISSYYLCLVDHYNQKISDREILNILQK